MLRNKKLLLCLYASCIITQAMPLFPSPSRLLTSCPTNFWRRQRSAFDAFSCVRLALSWVAFHNEANVIGNVLLKKELLSGKL